MHRFLPLGIALGLTMAAPAFAAVGSTIDDVSSCTSAEDKKCVSDVQKRWQREQRDFDRSLQAKLDQWREENPQVISGEWQEARRAFSEQLRQEATAFRKDMRERQRAFYEALKEKRPAGDTRLSTGSQPLLPGQQECADKYFGNPEMYRLCLRSARVELLLKLRQQAWDRTNGSSSSSSSK